MPKYIPLESLDLIFSAIAKRIDALESRITNSDSSGLTAAVNILKSDMEQAKKDILSNKSNISSTNSQVSVILENITPMKTKLDTIPAIPSNMAADPTIGFVLQNGQWKGYGLQNMSMGITSLKEKLDKYPDVTDAMKTDNKVYAFVNAKFEDIAPAGYDIAAYPQSATLEADGTWQIPVTPGFQIPEMPGQVEDGELIQDESTQDDADSNKTDVQPSKSKSK